MTKTPRAAKKLEQARFFLHLLQAESQKIFGKGGFALEAYLSACLGAAQAAFYRLEKEVGKATFARKQKAWRRRLSEEERAFFNWMMGQRDLDVHQEDPKTTIKEKALPWPLASILMGNPAHRHPAYGLHIFGPPGVVVPNLVPGGHPPFAAAWVFTHEVHLGAEEAAQACRKFLDLMESLVAEFQEGSSERATEGG